MEEIGKYKISDLVRESGLPRTTINDWLQRYEQYLTFAVQGKRRLYSERTLTVIREIAALRDAGKNSFEIEQELSQRHPVSPEITPPESQVSGVLADDDEDDDGDETGAAPAEAVREETGLVARRQADEIARLLSGQLQTIAARLESLEKERPAPPPRRDYAAWLVAVILLAAIAAGSWFALQETRRLRQENAEIREAVKLRDNELRDRSRQLEAITVNLDRNRKEYQQNLHELQGNMVKQQAQFETHLKRLAAEAGQSREALMLQIKEQFTAERLSLLRRLQDSDLSKEQRQELIRQLDQLGTKMTEAFERLNRTVPPAAAEKTDAPEPADAAKAAPGKNATDAAAPQPAPGNDAPVPLPDQTPATEKK